MTDLESDFIVDDIAEDAFPLLDELSQDIKLKKSDLKQALQDDFNLSNMFVERVYGAWELEKESDRNKKMAESLKKPHPAHRNRIKVLETFIKEIL